MDFLASQPQYFDHLAPIWFALPPEQRGTFYAVAKAAEPVKAEVGKHFKGTYPVRQGSLTVVASYNDFSIAHRAGRKVVLLNHGAGQRYGGRLKGHASYVGGNGRKDVALFLEPGPYAGQITREQGGNVVEIGVPSIDCWHETMLNRRMWEETLSAWLVSSPFQSLASSWRSSNDFYNPRSTSGETLLGQSSKGDRRRMLDVDGFHDEDGVRPIQDAERRSLPGSSGSVVPDLQRVAYGQVGSPLSQLRQVLSSWAMQTPGVRESIASQGLQSERKLESSLHALSEGTPSRGSGIGRLLQPLQWETAMSALSSPQASQWATIAVSWHWHCVSGVPETDWAWPEYKEAVVELSKHYKVIGHAHPRAWSRLERWYREVDIEPVQSFREVLNRACVYVCDNSSTLYEFASVGKPVVVLNSRYYRRDQEQGLRFWGLVPGLQVDHPSDFQPAVEKALITDPSEYRSVIEQVYAYTDGQAAKRAAEAILELGADMDPYKPKRRAETSERQPEQPQFPLARLQRIGASTAEIQRARSVWDSMESDEEKFAAAEEFDSMNDVELRAALQESQGVPDFNAMTIPQVMDWVGNNKGRAQIALDQERSREDSDEGDGRKTLINKLKRVINA